MHPRPTDLLRALRRHGDAALVARADETLVACAPFETIRVARGQAEINGRVVSCADPFDLVARRVREAGAATAIGWFGYDCIRYVEPAVCRVDGNLARGASSGEDAEVMLFESVATYRDGEVHLQGDRGTLEAALAAAERSPLPDLPEVPELPLESLRPTLGREGFLRAVATLKEAIRAGEIFQAVVSERFRADFDGDPIDLFEVLSRLSPSPYQFCLLSGARALVGASPEMLVRASADGVLETQPIAGTRPRGATPADERRLRAQLVRSVKERAEHLMLVDLARNDVGRVSEPGTVHVGEFAQVRKFGGVMHLVSRVQGRLAHGTDPFAALAACFPAGTLSGAPKIRAMQLVSQLEPEPRGFYGGAVVVADARGLDSCIAIRSIEVTGGEAVLQAGAGIVADSRPEMEYAEVAHKTRMTRKALAVARAMGAGPGGPVVGGEPAGRPDDGAEGALPPQREHSGRSPSAGVEQ
jgi:anthranilate/para-aminobenzoate synthase component I